MTATRRIFQPVRGRGLRKLLWKRLHLPRRIVHPLLRGAKRLANPAQARLRADHAARLEADSRAAARVPEALGFAPVEPEQLPGVGSALERCREVFGARRGGERGALRVSPRKGYLLALLRGSDFRCEPDLVRFLVSRPVLDTATAYLGTLPVLGGAALWWTPANDGRERSQLYHFDAEDERQLKLLVNVLDTGPDSGPFTLLPADRSAALRDESALRRRFRDEEVEAACGSGDPMRLEGPAGSGGFVDTSRCLHYGSRGVQRDRLVLMAQFLRFDCPTESTFAVRLSPDDYEACLADAGLDEVQQLALGLEPAAG